MKKRSVTCEIISPTQLKNGVEITYGIYKSPFGWCVIGVTNKKICQITFLKTNKTSEAEKQLRKTWPGAKLMHNDKATQTYANAVFKNLHRGNIEKPINVLLKGTNFQIKVWKALLEIPEGETVTYGALAKKIHTPKAVRAVGSACGKNAIPFLIPCHRVLASNGGLGGYSGGLPLKKAMLAVEKSFA